MREGARIYVAGGETTVGAALLGLLRQDGRYELVGAGEDEPDPTYGGAVDALFAQESPDYVFVVAGKSGGIEANRTRPADLMLHNLRVATTVIDSAHRHGVRKLLYLGSSCVYPRACAQPMRVDALMTGPLEPTNEAYALAKLAGIKLCEAYRIEHGAPFYSAIATNYYGPGDHFDAKNSHVIGALMRRMHDAKLAGDPVVSIWGSGKPRREFLYVDDLARACLVAMAEHTGEDPLNLGGGHSTSIAELAAVLREVVGYRGDLHFDTSKPDGMPDKVLAADAIATMGFAPTTSFADGLAETYRWFVQHAE